MATSKRKKRILIRFELGLWGIFCLGVVSLCIFLWMFLLGIWAGQTVFEPHKQGGGVLSKFAASIGKPVKELEIRTEQPQPQAVPETPPDSQQKGPEWADSEASYFSLQIGAFHDPALAEKAVEDWRARGYDTFLQSPDEDDDNFTRVFIGKFDKLADANQLAERLEQQEKVKAYIALLPASKIRLP